MISTKLTGISGNQSRTIRGDYRKGRYTVTGRLERVCGGY